MLHALQHIAVIGSDETVSLLFGGELGDALSVHIPGLRSTKLASAPLGAGIAVSVPLDRDRWCLWVFGAVPPVRELSATLEVLKQLSALLVAGGGAHASDGEIAQLRLKAILSSISEESLPRRRWLRACYVAGQLATALVEDDAATGLALARLSDGKVRQLWVSDSRFEVARDELGVLLGAAIRKKEDTTPLDRGLVAERLGVASMTFDLPEGGHGYAVLVIGPKQPANPIIAMTRELIALVAPVHRPLHMRYARWLALAALVAALGWLALPAPIYLTVPGVLLPDDVYGVPLTTEATLQEIRVGVGDRIQQGEVIAVFRSAKLEEQKAQGELEVTMEALNAESSLAAANFGEFQIAEKRLQIAKARLEQIESQITELLVRAPHDGRVVSALSKSDNGRLLPLGTELARIQRGNGFLVRMTPTRLDANLLHVGMEGVMYVRGVQGANPDIKLTSPPYIPVGSREEQTDLVALGQLRAGTDLRLISGMAGYARLEGAETIRFFALTRNLREFIRVKAWYYLGLHW
jgi:hypothetical protein